MATTFGTAEDTKVGRIRDRGGCRKNSGRLNGLSVKTYLDLAFGDILGLLMVSDHRSC